MTDYVSRATLVAGAIQAGTALAIANDSEPNVGKAMQMARAIYAEAREMMTTGAGQAQVEQAFPGTTEVQSGPQGGGATAPPPPQMPAPQSMPQGAPPQAQGMQQLQPNTSRDDAWAILVGELQANNGRLQNWWDNRTSTRGGPDFTHKNVQTQLKNGSWAKYGLFMKWCPDWAKPIINQFPPPQQQGAPQGPPQQPQGPPPQQQAGPVYNQDSVPF